MSDQKKPAQDITKLPKWAQERIALLEMRLRERTEEVLRAGARASENVPSDAAIVAPAFAGRQHVFRASDTVEFRLRGGEIVRVHHTDEGRRLSVSNAHGPLHIEPRAVNSIEIFGEEH